MINTATERQNTLSTILSALGNFWVESPEWASYAAMDADGSWRWFSAKPVLSRRSSSWRQNRKDDQVQLIEEAPRAWVEWENTLHSRPGKAPGSSF